MESSVERVLLLAGRQNLVGIMRYLQYPKAKGEDPRHVQYRKEYCSWQLLPATA